MAEAIVTIPVMVTVTVPDEFAAKVTRDDLVQMARAACPESTVHPGPPNGTQVEVNGVAQKDDSGGPIFADLFVGHDVDADSADIEFVDDFATAEQERGN
jgi:hypothetical protein